MGRRFAKRSRLGTTVLVSADHDQSMHILGVVDSTVPGATLNVRSNVALAGLTGEVGGLPDYDDANHDGYPENTNDFRIAVGYRAGDHTGSSVPLTAEGPGALLVRTPGHPRWCLAPSWVRTEIAHASRWRGRRRRGGAHESRNSVACCTKDW